MLQIPISSVIRMAAGCFSPAGKRARLSILIYHRVPSQRHPVFHRLPYAEVFEWQMQIVATLFNVLPLSEGVERLERGSLPARAACITFDDGYADNESIALPVLERLGLPATFFVATSYLDGGCMWNDRVIEAVCHARGPQLDLSALALGRHPIGGPEERRQAIAKLVAQLKYRCATERDDCAGAIEQAVGGHTPTDLMMTTKQVRALHDAGMEIGAHTVSHPILANIDAQRARQEIAGGKEELEGITGGQISSFAYPNGKRGRDYTDDHTRMVRSLGLRAAVTTEWGTAGMGHDPYQLPRFTPWDRTPAGFQLRLVRNYLARSRVLE